MTDLFDLPFEEEPEAEPQSRPVEARPAPAQSKPDNERRTTNAESRTPNGEPRTTNVEGPVAAPPRRVLSVTELTVRVRDLLEAEFFEVWVEGELSNCRVWNTGHLYFTLKDGASQIRAVIFRAALRYLKFKPADGLRVVARGRVSVYEPKGEYQLVCEHLEPHGLGALQLAFDQLKKKLQAEGLFDAARKRPLPGAAAQDRHRHVARRRGDSRHHQGAAAAIRECPPGDLPGPRAGRGRRAGDRAGAATDRPGPGRGRGHRRPRRRLDRGSVGLQRRGRGARDCASAGAGYRGGRP